MSHGGIEGVCHVNLKTPRGYRGESPASQLAATLSDFFYKILGPPLGVPLGLMYGTVFIAPKARPQAQTMGSRT